jgi:hypothetical protein
MFTSSSSSILLAFEIDSVYASSPNVVVGSGMVLSNLAAPAPILDANPPPVEEFEAV